MHSPAILTPEQAREVPELLRESRLVGGSHRPTEREVTLRVACLRRAPEGASMLDGPVEVRLLGVTAIAVAYDPRWPDERPSRLSLRPEDRLSSLDPWPFGEQGLELRVNALADQEQLEGAAVVSWLAGEPSEARRAPWRLSFGFDVASAAGLLWIACEAVAFSVRGEPLAVPTWIAEARAWWWHWEADARSRGAVVRAGTPAPRRAPPDPPFLLADDAGAPAELLRPLRVWFEAPFREAWSALAEVYPDLDTDAEECAAVLRRAFVDFEPWRFARAVVDSWIEGRRAHVRVWGVAYSPPEGDEAACARLDAWSFDLRRREAGWQIRTYVEEDVADEDVERCAPWIDAWPAGAVREALMEARRGSP